MLLCDVLFFITINMSVINLKYSNTSANKDNSFWNHIR
jgi:hypothetical protein